MIRAFLIFKHGILRGSLVKTILLLFDKHKLACIHVIYYHRIIMNLFWMVIIMKTSWKGSISFGMVYFPVNVYTATTDVDDVKLHYLHKKCNSRLHYKKYCETCKEEVKPEDLVKGYEYEKEKYIIITEEDIEKLPLKSKKVISMLNFIDESDIDPIYFEKAYYISPSNFNSSKAFELFRQAMLETNKVGIGKITLTSNEYISLIKPYEKGLIMYLLFYSNEVRSVGNITELDYSVDIHENELKMATSLISNMTATDFNLKDYKNEYQEALKKVIEAKINGQEIVSPPEAQNNIIDLMEALKASVDATKPKAKSKAKARKSS